MDSALAKDETEHERMTVDGWCLSQADARSKHNVVALVEKPAEPVMAPEPVVTQPVVVDRRRRPMSEEQKAKMRAAWVKRKERAALQAQPVPPLPDESPDVE
jgi:hypothetical protein